MNNVTSNTTAAWEAAQDDDGLRKAALERLVEGFFEIQNQIKNLPDTINDAQQKQIDLTTKEFAKKIDAIKLAIDQLPTDLDQQVENLRAITSESRAAIEEKAKEIDMKIDYQNSTSLSILSKSMLESVSLFQDHLNKAKENVLKTIEVDIGNHLRENESTLRQTAWIIIGVTVAINLISIGTMYFLR
ncbi:MULTISPECIES: hypothetical protein [Arsenophonus]|uniref:Uncharacterized protein n=3 Tax=Arsenophonus TaxID=637 RepID=D2U0K0_9GAMM|nr:MULTISPECIES: hypothetical protein [Arsenophonus]QBY46876.1 hypothetical protein ArsFIN_54870 [Arsenophonus nasoniae]CBA73881.1 hypothetical protein ARN_20280 [Arsenophonus nasoniae]